MVPSVRKKLQRLRDELQYLESKRESIEDPETLEQKEPGYAVQKSLEIAIESSLDIARELLAEHELSQPDQNRDVFRHLADSDIIPVRRVATYEEIASFRNVLVHEYIDVDTEKVFQALNNVGDINNLAEDLAEAIDDCR
jgi:uncharacterized protein YutE (UPF0331/DUF86 family)